MTKPLSVLEIIDSIPAESLPDPAMKEWLSRSVTEHILSFANLAVQHASIKREFAKVLRSIDLSAWEKVDKLREMLKGQENAEVKAKDPD